MNNKSNAIIMYNSLDFEPRHFRQCWLAPRAMYTAKCACCVFRTKALGKSHEEAWESTADTLESSRVDCELFVMFSETLYYCWFFWQSIGIFTDQSKTSWGQGPLVFWNCPAVSRTWVLSREGPKDLKHRVPRCKRKHKAKLCPNQGFNFY